MPESNQPPILPDSPEAGAGIDESTAAGPGCAGFYTARDAKNQRRVDFWMLTFALAYLGATAAVRWRESIPVALPWLLAGLAALLALQAVRSYLIFLRGADELLRRIQTGALAFGFGSGAVLTLLYPLFEGLGAPQLDGPAIAMVMMLSWTLGYWRGARRYSRGGSA